jgi:segregation and condensation protein B
MTKDRSEPELDRELPDVPPELRWREWMRRIEAVLFASAAPVPRDDLARVVGQGASVDLLGVASENGKNRTLRPGERP